MIGAWVTVTWITLTANAVMSSLTYLEYIQQGIYSILSSRRTMHTLAQGQERKRKERGRFNKKFETELDREERKGRERGRERGESIKHRVKMDRPCTGFENFDMCRAARSPPLHNRHQLAPEEYREPIS